MISTAAMAVEHGQFNRIRQVASIRTPCNTCMLYGNCTGPREFATQTTSQSVQVILQGSR